MTQLGAGFVPPTTKSLEGIFQDIRAQVSAEVKSDIQQEVVDRIIRICGSAFAGIKVEPKFTFAPTMPSVNPPSVEIASPQVYVTNELDLSELTKAIEDNSQLLRDTLAKISSPIRRTVYRDPDGQITSIVDEVM